MGKLALVLNGNFVAINVFLLHRSIEFGLLIVFEMLWPTPGKLSNLLVLVLKPRARPNRGSTSVIRVLLSPLLSGIH